MTRNKSLQYLCPISSPIQPLCGTTIQQPKSGINSPTHVLKQTLVLYTLNSAEQGRERERVPIEQATAIVHTRAPNESTKNKPFQIVATNLSLAEAIRHATRCPRSQFTCRGCECALARNMSPETLPPEGE